MLRWRSEGCLKTSRNELDCLEKREGNWTRSGDVYEIKIRFRSSISYVDREKRSRGGKVDARALLSPIRSAQAHDLRVRRGNMSGSR
jgi:hypothetical protein